MCANAADIRRIWPFKLKEISGGKTIVISAERSAEKYSRAFMRSTDE